MPFEGTKDFRFKESWTVSYVFRTGGILFACKLGEPSTETIMKRIATILLSLLAVAGCGCRNGRSTSSTETLESSQATYSDIVSFIVKGYQCGWAGMDFDEMGSLSQTYISCAPDYGYAETDINGDGVKELLIGSIDEDGTYRIFDIWTVNPDDGTLVHLAGGDDRDWFVVNGDGVIIESTVNVRQSSPQHKGWQIDGAKWVKMKGDAWHDSLMKVKFEKFSDLVKKEQLAGGYSKMRKPADEEIELLKKATDDDGMIIYTPLYVSSQVVAGTNYRFWCIWDDLGADLKEYKQPTKTYGYCWITVFKPLPGQGEPNVTSIEIESPVHEVAAFID